MHGKRATCRCVYRHNINTPTKKFNLNMWEEVSTVLKCGLDKLDADLAYRDNSEVRVYIHLIIIKLTKKKIAEIIDVMYSRSCMLQQQ